MSPSDPSPPLTVGSIGTARGGVNGDSDRPRSYTRKVRRRGPQKQDGAAQFRRTRGWDGAVGVSRYFLSVRMYWTSAQRSPSGSCRQAGIAPRPDVIFQKSSPSVSS